METLHKIAHDSRKRKFLMILPLLTVPFVIVLFVALGGGKKNNSALGANDHFFGIDKQLPDAYFKKEKEKDKLGLYEAIERDSSRLRSQQKKEFYDNFVDSNAQSVRPDLRMALQKSVTQYGRDEFEPIRGVNTLEFQSKNDSAETAIRQRLAQLSNEIRKKPASNERDNIGQNKYFSPKTISPPQKMAEAVNENNTTADPELDRINVMLDKVMYIQHPEKLKDSIAALRLKNTSKIFEVRLAKNVDDQAHQGFYELKPAQDSVQNIMNGIRAVIAQNQVLVTGAVVKLRLLQNIYVNDQLVKKDQLIYGLASLNNERLSLSIHSIRVGNSIYPVSLDVYDLDGLEGIYVPGSINRDVSKQSADEAISAIGLSSLDPSLGAQAASAGIQAAKILMNRKIKLVRVSLRAGYEVLLRDNKK